MKIKCERCRKELNVPFKNVGWTGVICDECVKKDKEKRVKRAGANK